MIDDTVDQCGELSRVAEVAVLDGVEDAHEFRVELEVTVEVRVPQVLDVFGQVAEEEDVFFADFAGDL